MLRSTCLTFLCVSALLVSGCTKSEEPAPHAAVATGEMMPIASISSERDVLLDQSQVKVVVAREVPSYEPLETFRKQREEVRIEYKSPEDLIAEAAAPKSTQAAELSSPAGGATGGEGFWKRLGFKALVGGGTTPSAPARRTETEDSAERGRDKPGDTGSETPSDDAESDDADRDEEEAAPSDEEKTADNEADDTAGVAGGEEDAGDDEDDAEEDQADDREDADDGKSDEAGDEADEDSAEDDDDDEEDADEEDDGSEDEPDESEDDDGID